MGGGDSDIRRTRYDNVARRIDRRIADFRRGITFHQVDGDIASPADITGIGIGHAAVDPIRGISGRHLEVCSTLNRETAVNVRCGRIIHIHQGEGTVQGDLARLLDTNGLAAEHVVRE